MFEKLLEKDILEKLNKRKSEIKKNDKLPQLDRLYVSFISKYNGIEITPDIEIFSYEEAIKENRYLETNFPKINKIMWMIGRTGQGDEWFMSKENNNNIMFYDHNQGEYSDVKQFMDLDVSFFEFLQMAFLYQDLENLLDERDEIDKEEINQFKVTINSINSNLYESYPFKYF